MSLPYPTDSITPAARFILRQDLESESMGHEPIPKNDVRGRGTVIDGHDLILVSGTFSVLEPIVEVVFQDNRGYFRQGGHIAFVHVDVSIITARIHTCNCIFFDHRNFAFVFYSPLPFCCIYDELLLRVYPSNGKSSFLISPNNARLHSRRHR